jgi:HD-GYP domain-containing protein (c-di-GMP phosphodiesterase class II)
MEMNTDLLTWDELTPVDISLLEVGAELAFPLYGQDNGATEYVLLVNRGQKLTDQVKSLVEAESGTQAYTKRKYMGAYEQHIDSRISAVLSDQTLPLEKRSKILYSNASTVMENVFVEGVSKETFSQAVGYAGHISDFLASNEGAMRALLAVTSKDYQIFTHSIHVCIFGLTLYYNTLFERKPELAPNVAVGLLFHDIGKSRIEASILQKPGMLTPIEWKIMKRHPVWGCDILEENGIKKDPMLDIVRYHHERLDGQGYPEGRTGGKVPTLGQIGAIADCFSAMTANRSYKRGLSAFNALDKMKEKNQAGQWFEPNLFESFVLMLGQ